MRYNVEYLLSILFAFATSLTRATLTVVPINQVVIVGNSVTLQCTTNFTGGFIRWSVYRLGDTADCVVLTGTSNVGACGDASRHSVQTTTTGEFDLVINPTLASDAGTYLCEDVIDPAAPKAFAVVGIVLYPTNIVSNVSSSCVSSQQVVVLTCTTVYNGSNLVPLLMTWTPTTPETVFSPVTNSTDAVFQSTATIRVNETDIHSYTCTVTFDSPIDNILPQRSASGPTHNRNAPTYANSAASSPYTFNCHRSSDPCYKVPACIGPVIGVTLGIYVLAGVAIAACNFCKNKTVVATGDVVDSRCYNFNCFNVNCVCINCRRTKSHTGNNRCEKLRRVHVPSPQNEVRNAGDYQDSHGKISLNPTECEPLQQRKDNSSRYKELPKGINEPPQPVKPQLFEIESADPNDVVYAELKAPTHPRSRLPIIEPSTTIYASIASA